MNQIRNKIEYNYNSNSLRRLRIFVKSLCKRYNINFTLCVEECKSSFDVKEEIQLRIKDNDEQLFYSEIPICPVTDEMIENTISNLKLIFKYTDLEN